MKKSNALSAGISIVTVLLTIFSNVAGATFVEPAKRILVFGDSNSWGWKPVANFFPTDRYPRDMRWPGVLDNELGKNYVVIEEALSARTSIFDDDTFEGLGMPLPGHSFNGLKALPGIIASHMPLDLVIIMLGGNDVKAQFAASPLDISLGLLQLASEVKKNSGLGTIYSPAQVMIVSPVPLGESPDNDLVKSIFPQESIEKSLALAGVLGPLAIAANIPFFDAASVVPRVKGIDGVHLTRSTHNALGKAIAKEVKKILK
ncbi:MAG: GDSL-type esterase/lipase family protein [Cellvibrionaceae bacterium]